MVPIRIFLLIYEGTKCLFEYEITCNIEICKKKSHLERNILQKGVPIFVASWAHCAHLAA